jgi:hypothetical protein
LSNLLVIGRRGLAPARSERLESESDGSAAPLPAVISLRREVLRVVHPEDQDEQKDNQRSDDEQYERHEPTSSSDSAKSCSPRAVTRLILPA